MLNCMRRSEIFWKYEGFPVFLSPDMTNFVQPIDAVLARKFCCTIARLLYEWLMEADNMTLWELNITEFEKRILLI